jgi:hypothetical protein
MDVVDGRRLLGGLLCKPKGKGQARMSWGELQGLGYITFCRACLMQLSGLGFSQVWALWPQLLLAFAVAQQVCMDPVHVKPEKSKNRVAFMSGKPPIETRPIR